MDSTRGTGGEHPVWVRVALQRCPSLWSLPAGPFCTLCADGGSTLVECQAIGKQPATQERNYSHVFIVSQRELSLCEGPSLGCMLDDAICAKFVEDFKQLGFSDF